MYAFLFGHFSVLGIEFAGASQLMAFPGLDKTTTHRLFPTRPLGTTIAPQTPAVTLINPISGRPNPRYWVLKLLIDELSPGGGLSVLAPSTLGTGGVYSQVYRLGSQTKILLANTKAVPCNVSVPSHALTRVVDSASGEGWYRNETTHQNGMLELAPFAVAVVVVDDPARPHFRLKTDDQIVATCADPTDCTDDLQRAILAAHYPVGSGQLLVPALPNGVPWIVRPIFLNVSNLRITFAPEVEVLAMRDEFRGEQHK